MYFHDQNISELFKYKEILFRQSPAQIFIRKYQSMIGNAKVILLIVIITIGLIGNTFNLIVFGRRNMRQVSTFRFLFYLSAVDFLVIATGATHLLIRQLFNFDFRVYSNLVCKFHTFLTYVTSHASSIILMSVSIDRAIKVKSLLRKKTTSRQTEQSSTNSTTTKNRITIGVNNTNR